MTATFSWTRANTPIERLAYESWPDIIVDGLGAEAIAKVHLLTQAIKDYIDGVPSDSSLESRGIYRTTVLRAFRRCSSLDGFGKVVGWPGILPYFRLRQPVRRAPLVQSGRNAQGGLTGALASTLNSYPAIREGLDDFLTGCALRRAGYEAGISAATAHGKFLGLCKDAGIPEYKWPFTTMYKGKESIRRYCNRFLDENYDQIVSTQYGSKARARANTSSGYKSQLVCTRPFDIVELDEHKCGFIGAIGIPSPEGLRWLPMERFTIVLVVERFYSVVLGYSVVLRREANSGDILDALNAALGAEAPSCDMEGLVRSSVAKLPRELAETFQWCGFDALLVDNALAHLSNEVVERARSIIGCDVNFGPKARFERRALVENVFGMLEKRGFRRTSLTTGIGPNDPQRQSPEATASQARVPLEAMLQFIDDVISEYNTHRGKANYGDSPMGRLEAGNDDQDRMGFMFPVLPPLLPHVAGLDMSVYSATIRGDKAKGRRPYFGFMKESYTGLELSRRFDLVGKNVHIHVRRKAIKSVKVYTKSGGFVDTCMVMGRWSHHEHSIDTRSHINSLIASGQLRVAYGESAVAKFNDAIAKAAGSPKAGRQPTKRELSVYAETSGLAETQPEHDGCVGQPDPEEMTRRQHSAKDQLPELDDDSDISSPDEYLDYDITHLLGVESDDH